MDEDEGSAAVKRTNMRILLHQFTEDTEMSTNTPAVQQFLCLLFLCLNVNMSHQCFTSASRQRADQKPSIFDRTLGLGVSGNLMVNEATCILIHVYYYKKEKTKEEFSMILQLEKLKFGPSKTVDLCLNWNMYVIRELGFIY